MQNMSGEYASSLSQLALVSALVDNASGAMFVLDGQNHCVFMNQAAEELTGFRLHEVCDRPLHDILHHTRPDGSPYHLHECPIDQAFPRGNRERGRELFIHKEGHFYPIEYTVSPVRVASTVVGTVLEARDIRVETEAVRALEEEKQTLELINRTGQMLAAKLELGELVQAVTDAATELSGARFGAFFYNGFRDGDELQLYTLSGAPREAFFAFPQPQHTAVFAPTFADGEVIRVGDIKADPRYGKSAPHHGMPQGHLPVTSYMAVPVTSRSGDIVGALIFGHERPDVFSERSERLVTAIAAQATVAIDNSRLYEAAQREIAERQRYEDHQKLLIQELNHRVKNMLATVRSIATQTFRQQDHRAALKAFDERLLALSRSHSLIMREHWREVDLEALIATSLAPYLEEEVFERRATLAGPPIRLSPKAALALGMGFHELATNALKHGALKPMAQGRIEARWREVEDDVLCITWVEKDGPPVSLPEHKGFGTRLLERGMAHELGGTIRMIHDQSGFVCEMRIPMEGVTP